MRKVKIKKSISHPIPERKKNLNDLIISLLFVSIGFIYVH